MNWALLLVALLCALQSWAPETTLIWRVDDNLTVDLLPTTTLIWIGFGLGDQ